MEFTAQNPLHDASIPAPNRVAAPGDVELGSFPQSDSSEATSRPLNLKQTRAAAMETLAAQREELFEVRVRLSI